MAKVFLKGHSHYYHIRDVLGMFYGGTREYDGYIETLSKDDILISSILEKNNLITAWESNKIKGRLEDKTFKSSEHRQIKKHLYLALRQLTGKNLPWGSLTGIRPTLVACETGFSRERLMDEYFLSPEKANLAVETAIREERIKKDIGKDSFHCYIGIPLCKSKCNFCSFPSGELSVYNKWLPDYMEALNREITIIMPKIREKIHSVYIGGGTPSVLTAEQIKNLLEKIKISIKGAKPREITFEAGRPDCLSPEKIEAIKSGGTDRICINPQSLNDKTLNVTGRNHTADDFYKIYDVASKAGFRSINADIIAGLSGEDTDDFKNTLNRLIDISPDNITVHCLSLKKTARLSSDASKKNFNMPSRNVTDMINYSLIKLKENNYIPYYLYRQKDTLGGHENTGYAKNKNFCMYNVAMMGDNNPVIGFGAKAVSKKISHNNSETVIERYYNIRDIILYIKNIDRIIEEKIKFFGL